MKTAFPTAKMGVGYAHGKIILLGEHAVVYGVDAIAWPLNSSLFKAEAFLEETPWVTSSLYEGPMENSPDFFKSFLHQLQTALQLPPFSLRIQSDLPLGAGLGSSAAMAGSITEALFSLANQPLTLHDRLAWIQVFEKTVHGNPSGIDALVTSTRLPVRFNKVTGFQTLSTPKRGYLTIAHSQIFGSTKEAVKKVAEYVALHGKQSIEKIGQWVQEALLFIQQGNVEALGTLMNQTHTVLATLGVSHPTVDSMVATAQREGALGAKMTGGGLGGCVIALFAQKEEAERLGHQWKKQGFNPVWILPLHQDE